MANRTRTLTATGALLLLVLTGCNSGLANDDPTCWDEPCTAEARQACDAYHAFHPEMKWSIYLEQRLLYSSRGSEVRMAVRYRELNDACFKAMHDSWWSGAVPVP